MNQEKINDTENMKVFLEGLSFEEKEGKEGLWVKSLIKNGIKYFLYWDLRKQVPFFYVYEEGKDKTLPKKENGTFEEYMLFSEKFNIKEEKGKPKDNPVPSSSSIQVLDRKDQAYTLINSKDDQQILLELQGSFLDEFVYSFPTKEGKVTGLSWAGVKEVARRMGNVSVEDINITETPTSYRVLAKAKDINKGVVMFGVAEQSKNLKLKDGNSFEDLHALSKCVSRAQRNAIRSLIPEMLIKGLIEEYLK